LRVRAAQSISSVDGPAKVAQNANLKDADTG
jgi:hypothetical protein